MSPLVRGRKVTENRQEALGAREGSGGRGGGKGGGCGWWGVRERGLGGWRFGGGAGGPGMLLKMGGVGVRGGRGSGLPRPVRGAAMGVGEVGMVRVPVRGPVEVGVRMMLMKQEALGARE